MFVLLRRVKRLAALPLVLSLGVELVSSFMLPTAILMVFYETGLTMGVNAPLVLAVLVLWVVCLVVTSISSTVDGSMWLYEHSAIMGGFVMLLMILYMIQDLSALANKYFMELVVVLTWVGCIVAASIIHGQWSCVFGAVAPLSWLLLSPAMFVVVPIYAICNFDDVSWGTRGG